MIKRPPECTVCRKIIPPETVERRGGKCLRCYRQQALVPPPGSGKLRQLYDRLVAVDQDPMPIMVNKWKHQDPDFLRSLEHAEEVKARFLLWMPLLRTHEQQCRKRTPLMNESQLTPELRAKQQVMQTVMTQPYALKYRATIVTMPLLALTLAHQLWPFVNENVVYLTCEELNAWKSRKQAFDHKHWWYSFQGLDWDESPFNDVFMRREDVDALLRKHRLQAHEVPWLVSIRETTGPLCGHGHSDLWVWDGQTPRLLKQHVSGWVS